MPRPGGRIHATVEWWREEEGWGALAATDETPGGIFVHFSSLQMDGYKSLRTGQKVDAKVEGPLRFKQDGCLAAHISRDRLAGGEVRGERACVILAGASLAAP